MNNAIIAAILGSSVISALISGVFGLIQTHRAKHHGMISAVRILLYDRIKYLGRKYIDAGEITHEDLEDILRMHSIYHDEVDGNGYLDSVIENVRKLKIVEGYKEADY